MDNDNQDPESNTSAADGKEPDNSGTSVKTVPESDFQALKQSLESKLSESETKLTKAEATLETERAGHKPVEEKAGLVDGLAIEVEDLKTKLSTSETAAQVLQDQNLSDVRKKLVNDYHLPQEKVDAFNLEQARLFLDTLPAPQTVSPANYDMNSSGAGGDISTLSAREKIRQGL